jgi:hypothetical protein
LESLQNYEIKILAFNKIGSSDYNSDIIKVKTIEKRFLLDNQIKISNAKFKLKTKDEICFEARFIDNDNNKLSFKINFLNNNNNMSNEVLIKDFQIINGFNCIDYSKYLSPTDDEQRVVVVAYLPTAMKLFDLPNESTIEISLCFSNDTSICTQEVIVADSIVDISNYFTLIAIACSILFIFLILIFVSICCCCLRKNQKNDDTKLVVKTIPTLSISYPQQQHKVDFGDDSTKSTLSNSNFYLIGNTNIHVSDDSNKFCKFNQPSVLTVESDVISSNSSSAISSAGENSVQSNNRNNGNMLSDCSKHLSLSKQALLYAPQTNIYSIKSQQQHILNNESAESGYSTPTNHFNKKLFYEVIV